MTRFYDCDHQLVRNDALKAVTCGRCDAAVSVTMLAWCAVNDQLTSYAAFGRLLRFVAWIEHLAPAEVYRG